MVSDIISYLVAAAGLVGVLVLVVLGWSVMWELFLKKHRIFRYIPQHCMPFTISDQGSYGLWRGVI